MSDLIFYKYAGKENFKQITSEEVKKLKEINLISAHKFIENFMFINNTNIAFTSLEVEEILNFVQTLKNKHNET